MNKYQKKIVFLSLPIFVGIILITSTLLVSFSMKKLYGQASETNSTSNIELVEENKKSDGLVKGLGLIGAGIAFGLATLGAGIGIGNASSAAIGALSEKPSMFGISLVFVALCEGLVIFGFVLAAMIMGRI